MAMSRFQPAFYRSGLVRWSLILSGGFLTFDLSPWSPPQWRNTPSLDWLHTKALGVGIPWWVLSAAFLVYTLLLLWGSVAMAVIADFLGLFLYLCELIALMVSANPSMANPWVFVAFALVCVLHIAAGRLALIQRESL